MQDREGTLAQLQAEIATLRMRTEALEAQLAAVTSGDRTPVVAPERARAAGDEPPATTSVSRRDLLRQTGVAVAAGAAGALGASLLVAGPASAGPAFLELGRSDNASTTPTGLIVNPATGQFGLGVVDHALSSIPQSASLFGHASGISQVAVLGFHEADHAIAIEGLATGETGKGVYGQADHGIGVEGNTVDGFGVYGVGGSGIGVIGSAASGRGGVFHGRAAAIQLTPTNASTHPTHGAAGDLIVDKHNRLWFCKGDTNWKHVA